MNLDHIIKQIVEDYSKLEEVVVITIAGSRSSNREDSLSDVDIDLFLKAPIAIEKRIEIASKYSDQMEIDNQYFGTGDEFFLRDISVEIDVCLFDYEDIISGVKNVMERYQASTGYTTCFLHNITKAEIVFDRTQAFTQLVNDYRGKYPVQLKENIIKKNYPLLRDCFSSYYNQVEKAVKREDDNSVLHRVTAFLASYYDIIFAINEIPHPGEKRLLNIIEQACSLYPEDYKEDILHLIKSIGYDNSEVLNTLTKLVDDLEMLLNDLKLF